MRCWKCATVIEQKFGPLNIGRNDSCPTCDYDLHVCKNCRFYDPSSYNECRENQAEWVREKDKLNFCDHFEPNTFTETSTGINRKTRSTFDSLFKE
jgi:hypothetical protein